MGHFIEPDEPADQKRGAEEEGTVLLFLAMAVVGVLLAVWLV